MNDRVSDVSEKYLRGPKSNVSNQASADERLRKLKALHKDGIISDEEFESKKKEILAEL
tara:strand:- start:52 stop:228 length:177 start_codon:yes stop_codon:yes gene_type:complete